MLKAVTLKRNREEPLLRRHPWLFSGAIEEVSGEPGLGETVEILDSGGEWIARGAYSPHSQIRVRVWTWDQDVVVDAEFIRARVARALQLRVPESDAKAQAYREIHAESDLLPGVVVDRYAGYRVVQILSAGAERWRQALGEALIAEGDCIGVFERSDVDVRELEGLEPRTGIIWGAEPPERVKIREGDLVYSVDIRSGHKTGFYLDQRLNRQHVRKWIGGGSVLDAFCYTGGFALNAFRGGASEILALDSSEQALREAAKHAEMNGVPAGAIQWHRADVFSELRSLRDHGREFDVVILDPPRFAPTSAHIHKASRAYKDINLFGFKLLKPGGRLITFSCSGGVSAELFQKIVADAALDANVEAQIRGWMEQSPDHPVLTSFPEGRYLKGLVCTI